MKNRSCFSISECVCNPNGSTTLECGKDNGVCSCKERFVGIKCNDCIPNVVGDKCDTCQPGFFGYPSCQEGLSKLIMQVFFLSQSYPPISECQCNPDGSTTLECFNGDCSCKERVRGLKCDECIPNYFNYPLCQGTV